jgi:oligopeptide transport system permease protein
MIPLSLQHMIKKLYQDRIGFAAFLVVGLYALVALTVVVGFLGQDWDMLVADGRMEANFTHWFGTNTIGQDVFARAMYSTKTAFEVGLSVALSATLIGTVLGALAGFYTGGFVDRSISWLFSVMDCMPFYLFVAAVAYALQGFYLSMHIAMIATFWTGTARLIRGEVLKLKELEFITASRSYGASNLRIIFRHILPNTSHIILIEMSLLFVTAIKSEVILSFLGLGVKDSISWGLMISESTSEITSGIYNNFLSASGMLFILVMAFNLLADSLADALDPRSQRGTSL